jgi:hypothetical protein
MLNPVNYGSTRNDRRLAREAKRATKAAKRDLRREAKQDRLKGQGPPIAWELATTGERRAAP